MKLLFNYLKKYRGLLITSLVLATINQGFSLLDPQIFRMIVDRYVTPMADFTRHEFVTGILGLLGLSVLVALISRTAKNFQDYVVNMITERLGTKLYSDSVEHAFSLPFSVFEDERSGELLQKLQKARTDSKAFIQSMINTAFLSLVGMTFVLVYAFSTNVYIGFAYFSIIPILGGTIFIISKRIRLAQQKIIVQSAALAGATTETLRNVELVKSLGLEEQEINRLNDVNQSILELELQKIKLVRTLSFIQGTFVNAIRAGLLFLMLYLVFLGSITFGEFFSLYFYSFFVLGPLGELASSATLYQETKASLGRVEELLAQQPAPRDENAQDVGQVATIAFNKVSFAYQSTLEKSALANLDLSIKAGETVAFVGPSGSGKTTLVKLITGLYNPTSGTIAYNGVAEDKVDFDILRKKIGLVAQDVQLFAGTIRENLVFVKQGATDEECLHVLAEAEASSILMRSGEGLDTKIGEGGLKLSGGERQRLAIARALLRHPDVLIFDEATSALDSITEHAITETIRKVSETEQQMIKILIAHRLSTIRHADRIYVLEKGKIIESGTHQSLLDAQGLYAALWRGQSSEAEMV